MGDLSFSLRAKSICLGPRKTSNGEDCEIVAMGFQEDTRGEIVIFTDPQRSRWWIQPVNLFSEDAIPAIPHGEHESIPLGRYVHYKGSVYEVLGTGTNVGSEETFVIYRATNQSEPFHWAREINNFQENVETVEGKQPRFAFLG